MRIVKQKMPELEVIPKMTRSYKTNMKIAEKIYYWTVTRTKEVYKEPLRLRDKK